MEARDDRKDARGPGAGGRRVSPRGVVTLPARARAALGLKGGGEVKVSVQDGTVHLAPAPGGGPGTREVSARGQMQLPADAHEALNGRRKGRVGVDPGDGQEVRIRAL